MTPVHLIFTGAIGSAVVGILLIINFFFMMSRTLENASSKTVWRILVWQYIGMVILAIFGSLLSIGIIWYIIQKLG